jgi:hypothetical protein
MLSARENDPARRRLFGAIVVGWTAFMVSMLVGLFDGPDAVRDGLMLVGFVALVVVLVMAVRARRSSARR